MARSRFLRGTSGSFYALATGLALSASPVEAQEDPAQDAPSESVAEEPDTLEVPPTSSASGEIIVTGSRLNTGFAAPSPVSVTSSEQLRDASPGIISEALNQLPAFKNSSRAATAGPSGVRGNGAALLNLRGLEPQRTLVLLDGRRVVSSSAGGSPDVNLFPQDLVSRVEVVTGARQPRMVRMPWPAL